MPIQEFITRALIFHNNKILLCKNIKNPAHKYYFLPGGHIDPGESPEYALEREVMEEIGETVASMKKVAEVENQFTEDGKEYNEQTHVYVTTLKNYENIKGIEGHLAFEWISKEEFVKIDFKPEKVKTNILTFFDTP